MKRGRREQPVVVLVHGTYAREAAWTKPDSALSTALMAAGCAVAPFAWSGRNSHRARTQAADDLAEHLRGEIASNPKGRFWVVAHSHGGNVALHAVAELRRSQRTPPRISTIAFATPFIHSRDRKPPGWLMFVLLLFGPLLLLAAAEKIGAGPRSFMDWLLTVAGGLFAVTLLLCAAGAVLHGGVGDRRALVKAVHAPVVGQNELFIVRSAGDEASGLLTTGQFIGWVSGVLCRPLANLLFWAAIILFTHVSVIVSAVLGLRFGLTVMLDVFPLPGYAVVTVMTAMLLASLVFGLDGPFVCLFAFSSAEPAPPGQATLLQLEPFAVGAGGLAHSRLYGEDVVIHSVVDLIRGKAA